MIEWQDNSEYLLSDQVEHLRPLANRPLSSLLNERDDNLLVFPLSFQECEDRIGEQHLFDLEPRKKGYIAKTGNLAGFIGINDLQITIHSRFSEKEAKEDYFLHYMLQKVLSVNLFDLKHTTTNEQVLDFLFYLFPYYLKNALSQGLYKAYERKEYNDANARGTIDINRHIKTNVPFNGRVAYRTREFSHDNNLTQLIRHTIEYIRTRKMGNALLQNDPDTQAYVSQIILATPTYKRQDRLKVIQNNQKLTHHPYFTNYPPLQKLCLKILNHEQLKYGKEKDKIYGLIFDVAWLWEEYLATLLTRQGFKHPDNRRKTNGVWLGFHETKSHKNNAFLRFPDFYDREPDGIIIDAKYKQHINDVADINQIITYLYRLKGRLGLFIQPSICSGNPHSYTLRGYGIDQNAHLIKYQIPIPTNQTSYKAFVMKMRSLEHTIKMTLDHYRL